jgi:hypothetical protein
MNIRSTVALVVGATVIVAGGVAIGAGQKPTLSSGTAVKKKSALRPVSKATTGNQEALFRGDMIPDIGLGCSNPTGTSGGPNDWATKVTASLVPDFGVASTTYNIFTFNAGPTWNLVAWNNGSIPGTVIGTCVLPAGSGTQGDHTIAIAPGCLTIPPASAPTFFFGLSQGADLNGVRLGMDNTTSTPATVYIRAPGCGAAAFTAVENLGFPGHWVHRIIVDEGFPVELMDFGVS